MQPALTADNLQSSDPTAGVECLPFLYTCLIFALEISRAAFDIFWKWHFLRFGGCHAMTSRDDVARRVRDPNQRDSRGGCFKCQLDLLWIVVGLFLIFLSCFLFFFFLLFLFGFFLNLFIVFFLLFFLIFVVFQLESESPLTILILFLATQRFMTRLMKTRRRRTYRIWARIRWPIKSFSSSTPSRALVIDAPSILYYLSMNSRKRLLLRTLDKPSWFPCASLTEIYVYLRVKETVTEMYPYKLIWICVTDPRYNPVPENVGKFPITIIRHGKTDIAASVRYWLEMNWFMIRNPISKIRDYVMIAFDW